MRLTYLIGVPGVGKSTLLNGITNGLPGIAAKKPFARTIYDCGVVQLGAARAVFGGTDTLSLSVQPKVLDWAQMPDYPDIVGEGDRLANSKFFSAMKDLGYDLCIVHCHTSMQTATDRRIARADEHGIKAQDVSWVLGRITKYARLNEDWTTHALDLDRPAQEVISEAVALPILDTLWEARP